MKRGRAIDKQAPIGATTTRPELLVEGSDDMFRELVHNALAFTARLTAIRDGYGELIGLTGPQYTILISVAHLARHGSVGVRQVADHLSLSGTFITTETNKLVAAGLLFKQIDTTDRRRVSLSISDAGLARLRQLTPTQQAVNDVHFGTLDRPTFKILHRTLGDLIESSDRGLSLLRHLAMTPPSGDQRQSTETRPKPEISAS